MTATTDSNPILAPVVSPSVVEVPAAVPASFSPQDQQRIHALLSQLQGAAPLAQQRGTDPPAASARETQYENRLAVVRLGMASSLFYALRSKHAPTAAHCLRVALACSAWAARLGLDEATRDRIEVAALLHDLGKIGIPDRILRKPGRLTVDEQLIMDGCPQMTCEILRGCTADQELLNIVRYAGNWFDSRRHEDGPRGNALPLGSRMLSIADAFDAMTTDSVYRSALSRERAISELMEHSCTQFDPELTIDFNRMLEDKPEILQVAVIDRWLNQLQSNHGDSRWESPIVVGRDSSNENCSTPFYQQLIGHIADGVVFTDTEGTIVQWNERMRTLTSIAPGAMVGRLWSNECVRLRDPQQPSPQQSSPQQSSPQQSSLQGPSLIDECLASGATIDRVMLIDRSGAESMTVRVQVSPVRATSGGVLGTVITISDLSEKANLKQQLKTLHKKTTLDPLTGIANRAHFDSVLSELVRAAGSGRSTFSLVICDIDHFKSVNDQHGHPAGDEALKSFAKILSSHSRGDDLVARYGGEEFLLLAVGCDNATAAERAEAIRKTLERTPLKSLNDESVTASFGVTEFQSGDTPESVLARADRALLKAKDNGRNRVIQLGSGNKPVNVPKQTSRRWFGWFDPDPVAGHNEFDILAPVPSDLAIEKLRGFIADHAAEVINVKESQVSLKMNFRCQLGGRRRADRRIAIRAQLTMSDQRADEQTGNRFCKTNIHVILEPIRNRDRRSRELVECFHQVATSLNSYLVGQLRLSELS
jgi:diguanylate cyclase (GGDEF)-like protein